MQISNIHESIIVMKSTTEITELLAPWKKRSIAFEFWACSRDHLERPD